MSQPRRPTLLAVLAHPGSESVAPGGTLATSAWRGVRTVLVTLNGAEAPRQRKAATRAANLLCVESHFHWESSTHDDALRLARILRALGVSVVIANDAASSITEEAWKLASSHEVVMPGLPLFDRSQARLWRISSRDAATTRVDVSAARPLLRALRYYYDPEGVIPRVAVSDAPDNFEFFDLVNGAPLPPVEPVTDLFVGLSPSPARSPISFLGRIE